MAVDRLASSSRKLTLTVFEKRAGPAWKLFVAGSSGLNVTNSADLSQFAQQYSGPPSHWSAALKMFSPEDWIRFLETDLDQKTFLGTSGRYFVETMHAAKLVRAWKKRLEEKGVRFAFHHELTGFNPLENGQWSLDFASGLNTNADRVILALGGGSYEPKETPLRWPLVLQEKDLEFTEFSPANAGFHIVWKDGFLKEADGLPLKNVVFSNAKGSRKGDLIVTSYGIEGTPVYTLGEPGPAWLDLKPDLTLTQVISRLTAPRENLSLMRRAQKYLGLNPAALALLFHMAPQSWKMDLQAFAEGIKHFPLDLESPRPLSESISSRGGLSWNNFDEDLQFKKLAGIYAVGEMIDWEAPTGGYLIQGAVTQGAFVAVHVLNSLNEPCQ